MLLFNFLSQQESFYIPKLLNKIEPAVKQYEKAVDSKIPEIYTSATDTASSLDNSCIEKRVLDLKGSKLLQTEELNDLITKNTIQTILKEATQTGARESSFKGMIEVN